MIGKMRYRYYRREIYQRSREWRSGSMRNKEGWINKKKINKEGK